MSILAFEFQELKEEVDTFFDYLKKITQDESRIVTKSEDTEPLCEPFGREFKTILKANALLVLYHLVEATVQKSVDTIIESFDRETISYEEASDKIRELWCNLAVRQLRNAHEHTWENKLNVFLESCIDRDAIILKTRDILKSEAGNIDADNIRSLTKRFGFHLNSREISKGGCDLSKIKDSRNALAHGLQKFTYIGGQSTTGDLVKMKERVVYFLEDLIAGTESYILSRKYNRTASQLAQ